MISTVAEVELVLDQATGSTLNESVEVRPGPSLPFSGVTVSQDTEGKPSVHVSVPPPIFVMVTFVVVAVSVPALLQTMGDRLVVLSCILGGRVTTKVIVTCTGELSAFELKVKVAV